MLLSPSATMEAPTSKQVEVALASITAALRVELEEKIAAHFAAPLGDTPQWEDITTAVQKRARRDLGGIAHTVVARNREQLAPSQAHAPDVFNALYYGVKASLKRAADELLPSGTQAPKKKKGARRVSPEEPYTIFLVPRMPKMKQGTTLHDLSDRCIGTIVGDVYEKAVSPYCKGYTPDALTALNEVVSARLRQKVNEIFQVDAEGCVRVINPESLRRCAREREEEEFWKEKW
jgi:hypothetical protein